jgi:hypothetical protein
MQAVGLISFPGLRFHVSSFAVGRRTSKGTSSGGPFFFSAMGFLRFRFAEVSDFQRPISNV